MHRLIQVEMVAWKGADNLKLSTKCGVSGKRERGRRHRVLARTRGGGCSCAVLSRTVKTRTRASEEKAVPDRRDDVKKEQRCTPRSSSVACV